MRKHGLRPGYLGPRTGSATQRQEGLVPAAGVEHDARRSALLTVARARAVGRRIVDAWLNAQVRVAGPPWDSGSFATAGSAVAVRSTRRGGGTDRERRVAG